VDGENGRKFSNAEELAALLARLWGRRGTNVSSC